MTYLSLAALTGARILTGVSGGRIGLSAVQCDLEKHTPGQPICLDFDEIEALGGSALRHLIQGIKAHPSCSGSAIVLANLDADGLAEADLVAEATRSPFIAAEVSDGGITRAVVRGPLDDKVSKTLSLILDAGEADAQTISQLSNESGVVTVWNNRLVTLHSMGLLSERKVGKRKLYSPVIEGLRYGDGFHSQ